MKEKIVICRNCHQEPECKNCHDLFEEHQLILCEGDRHFCDAQCYFETTFEGEETRTTIQK